MKSVDITAASTWRPLNARTPFRLDGEADVLDETLGGIAVRHGIGCEGTHLHSGVRVRQNADPLDLQLADVDCCKGPSLLPDVAEQVPRLLRHILDAWTPPQVVSPYVSPCCQTTRHIRILADLIESATS